MVLPFSATHVPSWHSNANIVEWLLVEHLTLASQWLVIHISSWLFSIPRMKRLYQRNPTQAYVLTYSRCCNCGFGKGSQPWCLKMMWAHVCKRVARRCTDPKRKQLRKYQKEGLEGFKECTSVCDWGLQLQWAWCTDAREQHGRYWGTSISTCKNHQEIQTPRETKKRTLMYRGITVSLKVISVLSLWSRMEVISSHLSILPPFLVHLKYLKLYKAPTMCQIIPKFHSVSVYGALMCQVFLWALKHKDKKHGPWTLRDRGKAAVHLMKLIDIFVEVTNQLLFGC